MLHWRWANAIVCVYTEDDSVSPLLCFFVQPGGRGTSLNHCRFLSLGLPLLLLIICLFACLKEFVACDVTRMNEVVSIYYIFVRSAR